MTRTINILIACEHSGAIRDAFMNRNDLLGLTTFEAYSNDLHNISPEGEWSGNHLYGDCLWWIANPPRELEIRQWDLIIAHPPCTFVSSSGLHWNTRPEGVASGRPAKTEAAVAFARQLIDTQYAPFVAVENPIGCLSTRIRKPDQIVQPWQFGDDASKATCLWLKGLPVLVSDPAQHYPPRLIEQPKGSGKFVKRWGNQTDSGQNKLGPSDDRWKERSKTYPGIASAVANQWGDFLCNHFGVPMAPRA